MQKLSPSRTVVTSFTPRRRPPSLLSGVAAVENHHTNDQVEEDDDGDWVLCLAASTPTVSCALSNGNIQVYDQQTLHLLATYRHPNHTTASGRNNHNGIGNGGGRNGSAAVVTDLLYWNDGSNNDDQVLISSCHRGSLAVTDLRQKQTASVLQISPHHHHSSSSVEGITSVSLGYGGTIAALGTNKAKIHFVDLRKCGTSHDNNGSNLLGSYVNAHTDVISQVAFSRGGELLLSAGEDGLVCCYDTTQPTEELALQTIMNVGTPCRKVGFCGGNTSNTCCYVLTGSETASVWNVQTACCVQTLEDLRQRQSIAEESCSFSNVGQQLPSIDYLVDAHWDEDRQELQLCAGNYHGDALFCKWPSSSSSSPADWKIPYGLTGGHRGVVRAWARGMSEGILFTAGEDARLCEWRTTTAATMLHEPQQLNSTNNKRVASEALLNGSGGPIQRRRLGTAANPY